jgi:glutamate synthase domain-containing protein 2/glutamate synthase domain-containing protein 1/glutamate synthase domain-containing protein 3
MSSLTFPLVDTVDRSACGIGFIAESSGTASRRVVTLALTALRRLGHRGAKGADDETGDGSGLMTDIPRELFLELVGRETKAPPKGDEELGVAMAFTTETGATALESAMERSAAKLGMRFLGRREVPVRTDVLGEMARDSMPLVVQLFVACPKSDPRPVEARLYLLRRRIESELASDGDTFICSLSSRTIVYKGLLTPRQLERFYLDLGDERYRARVALFHERFATNTLPSWHLAQPFRLLAHNGEINTIRGNRLWMQAREREMRSEFWGDDLGALLPITSDATSDSLSLDNVLEFLTRSGRSLHHNLMMMIPDPYRGAPGMPSQLRDFFIYHENLMEPWDGPAALVFTDGEIVGAKLDRNALRPLRYTRTRDGLVVMASEAGVVDVDEDNLVHNRHMTSGEILSLRLDGSGARSSSEIKNEVASSAPYSDMVRDFVSLRRREPREEFGDFALPPTGFDRRLRVAFGWHREEVTRFLLPMTRSGREPLGSMGDDTPPAILSDFDRRFYDYFKQSFAQVTNPPIDPIREALVTGLYKYLGTEDNLFSERPGVQSAIRIAGPVLSPRETRFLQQAHDWFPHATVSCLFGREQHPEERLEQICQESAAAVEEGCRIIFLSDENLSEDLLPLPMPLAASAVHHDLIRRRCRSAVALVCIAGDVVSDHHVACLTAMGVSAVYPYLAYELIREQFAESDEWPQLMANFRQALEKGLLKIMAKMGVSTVNSYHGSMNLHALGLSRELLDRYFPSIDGRLGGIDLEAIRAACLDRCRRAFDAPELDLPDLGHFRYRRRGEEHGFAPDQVREIRRLAESGTGPRPRGSSPTVQLRDLFELESRNPIPPEDVEPAESLLRRFGAGAMSFGAVSDETHRTLAKGFHLVGGRSSSGEGGEPADRYAIGRRDQSSNCYIKQVASGRFGVTTDYLAAARELQIKMAQGAKPGEGGQLPGHKVTLEIAAARATTPGVPLISPPPHHDIYSIEDLAQLIFDLKEVNPRSKVSVKLVAQPGIGTIACGVVKAGADVVLVSGGDGGTGASPLGSLKHTGFPWELALAETHQALTASGLRPRARLRVDGGMKSGRDVVLAALLGAEEFDFGTAALVALGCVMARQCHMNTCPVGIATQDPELRARFSGTPEQLASYLRAVAEETRAYLAELGCRRLDDSVGRTDLLTLSARGQAIVDERGLDLDPILNPGAPGGLPLAASRSAAVDVARGRTSLDQEVLEEVYPTLLTHGQAVVTRRVRNTDRAVGTRLSGELAFLYGAGNFRGHLQLKLQGVAGQSLGAFLTDGIQIRLRGLANDYVGKGMSGGLVSIRMPRGIRETGRAHTVIGNVALYGATAGTLLVAGRAGERFAVRNSGASAVVEGVGNHACEYMTRGTVIVLGDIGWNFGAGMTGGVAYLLPATDSWRDQLNLDYVRAEPVGPADEQLLLKLLHEHVFHCGSVVGRDLLDSWPEPLERFVRVVPLAQDIVDFKAIYNQQVAARMSVLLNE